MNIKRDIVTLLSVLTVCLTGNAQTTITRGTQVTTEANVVSGKPYLLYYLGNGNCYVIADNVYFG